MTRPTTAHATRTVALVASLLLAMAVTAAAQVGSGSASALRFYGTGVGPPGQQDRIRLLTPYGRYLVVAAEKHDAGAAYPSFNGYVDELRIWNVARGAAEIAADRFRVLPAGTPGLVGSYRFEEGAGTVVADSSGARKASRISKSLARLSKAADWTPSLAHEPSPRRRALGREEIP